jgi:hypothetical protein
VTGVGLLIPFRTLRPRLVVADATVDHDRVVRGTNDIGLKAQDQRVGGVDRPRVAQPPPVLGQEVGSQSGKQIMHRQERGLLLDEAVNGEAAAVNLRLMSLSRCSGSEPRDCSDAPSRRGIT